MGKRAREKKMQKTEAAELEKQQVILRRQERLSATIQFARKFALTLFATVVLLWVGVFVTGKIGVLLAAFGKEGM
jgi:hypothetical protein